MSEDRGIFERLKMDAFDVQEEIEIIGLINDGGYPAKKAAPRARERAKRGTEPIALANVFKKEADRVSLSLCQNDLGEGVRLLGSTRSGGLMSLPCGAAYGIRGMRK